MRLIIIFLHLVLGEKKAFPNLGQKNIVFRHLLVDSRNIRLQADTMPSSGASCRRPLQKESCVELPGTKSYRKTPSMEASVASTTRSSNDPLQGNIDRP